MFSITILFKKTIKKQKKVQTTALIMFYVDTVNVVWLSNLLYFFIKIQCFYINLALSLNLYGRKKIEISIIIMLNNRPALLHVGLFLYIIMDDYFKMENLFQLYLMAICYPFVSEISSIIRFVFVQRQICSVIFWISFSVHDNMSFSKLLIC